MPRGEMNGWEDGRAKEACWGRRLQPDAEVTRVRAYSDLPSALAHAIRNIKASPLPVGRAKADLVASRE